MGRKPERPVVVVGGGPAGSTAALCLRKLGRPVTVLEKTRFPRYKVGESLLPGTFSIMSRLGLAEKLEAAGFPKKRAATFLWDDDGPPWTFSFATPKTAPWVFDHAYQVTRAEYDKILLDAAGERGASVRQGCEVTAIELGSLDEPAIVSWRQGEERGRIEAEFVIDGAGSAGLLATKLGVRQWDGELRNMAVWGYFRGGKRFEGDLKGNIFSEAFRDGWLWVIPLKDGIYSVGVVTGREASGRIREAGAEAFLRDAIRECSTAWKLLDGAEKISEARVTRDWSYDASSYSRGRAFLCGDAACFVDPLFSQGVHLATYSAMLAAGAIDRLLRHPEEAEEVHEWYDGSYREAYRRYRRFIGAFYAARGDRGEFWLRRTGSDGDELRAGAERLASLWRHGSRELSDEYDSGELAVRRVAWASGLLKQFHSMKAVHWDGDEVVLRDSFGVHSTEFRLERKRFIGERNGRMLRGHPMTEEHRSLFAGLAGEPLGFRELLRRLRSIGGAGPPLKILERMFEIGLLHGYDRNGECVEPEVAMRFGGVGGEDDLS